MSRIKKCGFLFISSLIITLQYQHSSTGATIIETVSGRHIQYNLLEAVSPTNV